jgi:hypothetical protein
VFANFRTVTGARGLTPMKSAKNSNVSIKGYILNKNIEMHHLPLLPWKADETGFCYILDATGQCVADTIPSGVPKENKARHGSTYQWNATQLIVDAANNYEMHSNLLAWAKANIPEMECRGDADCDHCVGLAILELET